MSKPTGAFLQIFVANAPKNGTNKPYSKVHHDEELIPYSCGILSGYEVDDWVITDLKLT